MIDTKITDEQRKYAWGVVSEHDYGKRGKFDGNKERQYTGVLGEVIVADALELPRPTGEGGFDKGIDFRIGGVKTDIKTMGRTSDVRPNFVNNLVHSQINYETELYIFCSLNKLKRLFTVCGLMAKEDVLKYQPIKEGETRKRSDGTEFHTQTDLIEIPMGDLWPVSEWKNILYFVNHHAF